VTAGSGVERWVRQSRRSYLLLTKRRGGPEPAMEKSALKTAGCRSGYHLPRVMVTRRQ
jgi:hypothetical protein